MNIKSGLLGVPLATQLAHMGLFFLMVDLMNVQVAFCDEPFVAYSAGVRPLFCLGQLGDCILT